MTETRRTLTFLGVAGVLALLAFVTAPGNVTPEAFTDQGEAFFPDFQDPNTATTLEVIEFNEESAAARPFKVTFDGRVWTIPSHNNYPADGKDRLAKTAAGVIGIRKDDFRSNNVADHEACGVLDPLDEGVTSLTGRGKRVTIRDGSNQVLADLIIGKKADEGREGYFVRIPGQKRVYVSKLDLDISTDFADWIEKDLLEIDKTDIDEITLQDYSINERTGRVDQRGTLTLTKDGADWAADKMSSNQEIDSTKMDALLTAVDGLSIVGVRPKPEGLSQSLKRSDDSTPISQSDVLSLQSKGYYFTRDGSLLSNEGEVEVKTASGVTYALRFGEILFGTGDALSAGDESNEDESAGPGENRYLFLTANFDADRLAEPRKPANMDFQGKEADALTDEDKANRDLFDQHEEWKKKVQEGQETADRLNNRFSDWYYVISAESFDKIKLGRGDLVKKKES